MIRFRCEHCREWLSIAEARAGEMGMCPLCKQATRIPQAGEASPTAEDGHSSEPHPMSRQSAGGDRPLSLLREPSKPDEHESQKVAFYCETQGPAHAASRPVVHREPETVAPSRARLIDVLLYPMNFDGLAATVILALGLWGVRLFPFLFWSPWYDFRITGLMVTYCLFGAWCAAIYFAFCIFDTSKGGTRTPAILPGYAYAGGELPSFMLMGAVASCFCPAAFYRIFGGNMGLYFWVLASAGAFLLPMLLLACTLLDSVEAFDLRFVVRSITATLPAYLGLIARLALLLSLAGALHLDSWQWGLPRVFFYAAYLYALWIAGHLLGRFYLRQKDKLQWDL